MSKALEYIRDISCLISENYSDKEPLTEEQKLSKNCFLDYCKCIKKELTALEIILEYKVDIWLLSECDYENYIRIRKEAMIENELIPKDKYEFLKEMITNEPN